MITVDQVFAAAEKEGLDRGRTCFEQRRPANAFTAPPSRAASQAEPASAGQTLMQLRLARTPG